MRPFHLLVSIALLAGCSAGEKVAENAFQWRAPVAPGATVHVRNTSGAIVVHGGEGPAVVRATKRWRRGKERDVRIVAVQEPGGVVICSLYDEDATCTSRRHPGSGSRRGLDRFLDMLSLRRRRPPDMVVDYDVTVPAGVAANVQTINGRIEVQDVSGGVRARTVNGTIRADGVGGSIDLTGVNGSVKADVATLGDEDHVRLKTVNGAVEATLPDVQHAQVKLETVNGRISNEYPLAATSSSRRGVRGTIGLGGRAITLETVNGPVRLRRATGAAAGASAAGAAGAAGATVSPW